MGLDMKILVDKIEFRFYSKVNVILSIRFIFLIFLTMSFRKNGESKTNYLNCH